MNNKKLGMAPVALLLLFWVLSTAAICSKVEKPSGWASPEIDGSLFVSLDRGRLSSLDPVTYERQWEFPAENEFACGGGKNRKAELDGIYEAPALDDDTVYFGAYDSAVYAVNREDGTCKWRIETGDPVVGGVVLTDDGLYVPSEDGFLYLLDPENGNEITKRETGDIWATPLVLDDAVYVATIRGKLWKLAPATLEPIWDEPFSVSAALLTPPTLADDDTILVGGIGKQLYAVNANDGSEKWSASGANWFWAQPTVDGDTIYATNLGKEVKALNAADGSEKWTFTSESAIRAGVVVVGDTIVAVNDAGQVYRLSASDGSLLGQPNELEETVHATPILLKTTSGSSGSIGPTASPSPSVSPSPSATADAGGGSLVLISTKSGHLWVLDVVQGRTTEVVN